MVYEQNIPGMTPPPLPLQMKKGAAKLRLIFKSALQKLKDKPPRNVRADCTRYSALPSGAHIGT